MTQEIGKLIGDPSRLALGKTRADAVALVGISFQETFSHGELRGGKLRGGKLRRGKCASEMPSAQERATAQLRRRGIPIAQLVGAQAVDGNIARQVARERN